MGDPCPSGLTTLLAAIKTGDAAAKERIFLAVYDDLRQHARRLLNHERADHTLDATALVNELYLKLFGSEAAISADCRGDLMAKLIHAMRQLLIDHARTRNREKRGGGNRREALDLWMDRLIEKGFDPTANLEALELLHKLKPRVADVATLRYQGFFAEEIAALLQISKSTVEADLREARTLLDNRSTKSDLGGSDTTKS